MSNEVVVIENVELVPFFTKGDNLDSVLEQIEKEAMSFVAGDLSVKKNRDAVKAMVTKVTKSKTYLETHGKDLAAEYKEIPKRIDANRKKTKDFLTELQTRVRQPLTEWEEEDKRIKAEEAARVEAEKIKAEIESDHEVALLMDEKFNRELADKLAEEVRLEQERIKAEAEKQRLREEEIRKEAEAKVKAQADKEKQQLIIDNAHGEALLMNRDIDDRAVEIARIAEKKADEAKAKQDAIDAEIKRKADIEQARIDAEAKAERDRKAEAQRQQDEVDRIAEEKAKREANEKHASMIMTQTKESIMAIGLSEEDAKKVTIALKNGKVANVGRINF